MNVFALIPAAGASRRMGREKLRLLVGGQPVLVRLLQCFRESGVDKVLVVLAPHTADLAAVVLEAGAAALCLPCATADMQETVQNGLAWLQAQWYPQREDAIFLCPADFPAIQPAVIRHLLDTMAQHPEAMVAVPASDGKRGHPVLFRWPVALDMMSAASGLGLNQVIRQYTGATLLIPVNDRGVLLDVDTPEDLSRLAEFLQAESPYRPSGESPRSPVRPSQGVSP